MLRYITKREILDNLLSLRLSLTLILMVITMSASALLFISDYKEAWSSYMVNVQENRRQMEEIFKNSETSQTLQRVIGREPQWVYKKPSNFTFLADGHDKDLPNAFEVNVLQMRGPHTRLRKNPLLQTYESMDWSLVIGVVMSFAAIVLTFDAISGDRERGTLKLAISNSVPRATILLGKYIGAFASLLIPLLAGMFLNVIIVSVSGIIPMDASAWARIGMVSLFSLLYVAGFTALGIFVSSIARESATSLIVLLLSWAMLVIVIPGVGGIIVSRFVEIPSSMQAWSDAQNAEESAGSEYLARHSEIPDTGWGDARNIAGPMAVAEAGMSVWNRYRDIVVRQIEIGKLVTRISPLGLYRHTAEAFAGTGIIHYVSFMNQVKQYRENLKSILLGKYPFDPHKDYGDIYTRWREVLDNLEFKPSELPELQENPISVEKAGKIAVWDIFFLSLFPILFIMGSVMVFLRYDVR